MLHAPDTALRCPSRRKPAAERGGFSLIELSVVLAIISVVAVMGLELTANYMNRTAYKTTQARLAAIDQAMVKFVKVNNRLPCPGALNMVPGNTCFGKENNGCTTTSAVCSATIIAGTSIQYGNVPVRDLGLPMNYMLDGYGNRVLYMVTQYETYNTLNSPSPPAQTFAAASDAIQVRSGKLDSSCGTGQCQDRGNAAYFLFSPGADRRGSSGLATTAVTSCNSPNFAATDGRIDSVNCRFTGTGAATLVKNGSTAISPAIPMSVFYDARYNSGTTDNHFDDIVKWRPKGGL